ncbi:MAG: UDP-N-acetylmuramoyl-tripeptide-D-alanyl-D-alanine ligase [Candidatus Nomurabacteria bacterium GW2011_GWF2_43_8]|uniref:UDP-N-acetylmuramoyl-tripeptide-D-alanyl-D-alanine ligase n=1 Tax=Candidatus Nomurabacteria bacterium GW2011_GWF2_43_8 TaxID=1618779 RepID=A0A0G1FSF8_9BACT|nr:MAG: UDP-N-acetylmuramoyl-tripeptide-D-alanyl-D-alanine ligase [Candidatus Nomurabacteria bacterium GW2011_GWF2_43_8]
MKMIFKKIIVYVLRAESRLVLWKYKPKIIAITGSVGKTSTKDAVYAVLSKISHVRKSEKSFNSEIGLPLTVLGVPNGWNDPLTWLLNALKGLWLFVSSHKYPKWLVLEVGVGKPSDMGRTASWLKTDAVIITAIGATPPHIEFFDSQGHLVEEKSQLIKTLKPDGLLVLNADDESVLQMKSKSKCRVITYGFKEGADVLGSGDSIFYNKKNELSEAGKPAGIIFRVDEGGKSLPVVIEGVFGRNHVYASLAALALSSDLKLNMLTAAESLKNYDVPPGRMRLLSGINGSLIIDDTYNSSPFACESALKTLGEIKNVKRKIVILGDMLELGKYTAEAHKNIGRVVKENADILIAVGQRAKGFKEGALEVYPDSSGAGMNSKNIFEFLDSRQAGDFLKTFVQTGDIVLIKGSQGMRMERAVEAILLDQENKEKLLVRQDEEWKKRE